MTEFADTCDGCGSHLLLRAGAMEGPWLCGYCWMEQHPAQPEGRAIALVRELAAEPRPWRSSPGECPWCIARDLDEGGLDNLEAHATICLWRRAKELVG